MHPRLNHRCELLRASAAEGLRVEPTAVRNLEAETMCRNTRTLSLAKVLGHLRTMTTTAISAFALAVPSFGDREKRLMRFAPTAAIGRVRI
jgi:hypothetical protein